MKVVVTSSSGKAGRALAAALLEHDYDVRTVDIVPAADASAPFLFAHARRSGSETAAGRSDRHPALFSAHRFPRSSDIRLPVKGSCCGFSLRLQWQWRLSP
jgi:nucleoside-diphosphate-sugar epimerase